MIQFDNLWTYDFEVFRYEWLVVFKEFETGHYEVIVNDNDALQEFMRQQPLLTGFNVKHYDNYINKGVLLDFTPEEIKELNDLIINDGIEGWQIPAIKDSGIFLKSFDLMDDMQQGLSLKAFEGHMGMDIEETGVDFNVDRKLTDEEIEKEIQYCKFDVDAAEVLLKKRLSYLENKLNLGRLKGLEDHRSLYMTNARLTAYYLDAKKPKVDRKDEREYQYPTNLKREYIQKEVFEFYDKFIDKNYPDEKVFNKDFKYTFNIGDCEVTTALGGIHGAIPTYIEESTDTRSIRNLDVGSYYPHLMTIEGYYSRNMSNPKKYDDVLETRMKAKKSGDKAKADAMKLICNTTYGAMGDKTNDLYDPKMERSVCITGQLRLLELANNLVANCPSLKVIQLNTDGIMVSLDNSDIGKYQEISKEWQDRTGFELEEDKIKKIIQKDVNNYIEVATDDSLKLKGGYLVRGISTKGAFNINNNATVIPKAIINYFVKNEPVEKTINECNDPLEYMLIAKASSKYSGVYQEVLNPDTEKVMKAWTQKCNRVYATNRPTLGTLYKVSIATGRPAKMPDLPEHCLIVNKDAKELPMNLVDKSWYITQAKKKINDFLGVKPPKKKVVKLKQELDDLIDNL